jgi:small GTP-binding protein
MFSFKRAKTQKRLKICIGGDGGVGKTSYFKALMGLNDKKYKHERNYNATPLNQYNLIILKVNTETNGEIILDIWDTAGQEFKDGDLRDSFLANADGAIILYDIQNAQTRQNVNNWLDRIRKICNETIPAVIVGNKMDKAKTDRANVIRECRFTSLTNIKTMLFSVRQRNNYSNSKSKGIAQVLDPIELLLQMYLNDKYLVITDIEVINSQLVNSN